MLMRIEPLPGLAPTIGRLVGMLAYARDVRETGAVRVSVDGNVSFQSRLSAYTANAAHFLVQASL
jgi:hypothetical protein